MKIIFDIGCNEGQNLKYFLKKADVVVGIEANPYLIDQIKVGHFFDFCTKIKN